MAAACTLARIPVDVVSTDAGVVVVLRDPSRTAAQDAARSLSTVLRTLPLVALRRGEESEGGAVDGSRWQGGERVADVVAAMVLSGAPAVVEDLLLHRVAVADVAGVRTNVGQSRWSAVRAMARGARRACRRS